MSAKILNFFHPFRRKVFKFSQLMICSLHFAERTDKFRQIEKLQLPQVYCSPSSLLVLRLTLSYRDIEKLFHERVVDVYKITLQRWVVKYIPMVKADFRKKKRTFGKRVIRRRHGNIVDYERYSKIITLADSIVVMNDYLVTEEHPNTCD